MHFSKLTYFFEFLLHRFFLNFFDIFIYLSTRFEGAKSIIASGWSFKAQHWGIFAIQFSTCTYLFFPNAKKNSFNYVNLFWWLSTKERRFALQTDGNNFFLFICYDLITLTILILYADIVVGREREFIILLSYMFFCFLLVNRSDLCMRSGLSSSAGGGLRSVCGVVLISKSCIISCIVRKFPPAAPWVREVGRFGPPL